MLELTNLSFEVEGKKILNDISLQFTENAFTVITGPNGGGKSTLAKLIMGIEKPTAGAILLDGKDITACSVDERARLGIGYAFQQPPRFKGMSVRRSLELAHGRPLEEENCISYLSDVDVLPRLSRPRWMPIVRWEVKRIEIATLLARELKVSIFDEPEAASICGAPVCGYVPRPA
ncbi:MAG: ATP-binding cassette domain-containing protein [Merdibacter sp.]